MKGLSPIERHYLLPAPDDGLYYAGEIGHVALKALQARGLLQARTVPDPESPTGLCQVSSLTDLGALALRVCPVSEP